MTAVRSTVNSRPCQFDASDPSFDCGVLNPDPGLLVVAKGAKLLVHGDGAGVPDYLSLQDQIVVENRGLFSIAGTGYVGADDGTVLKNRRTSAYVGTFRIRNDRGYYQGFTAADLGYAVPRSRFDNNGNVVKDRGTGTSILDADFRRLTGGKVIVRSGTLTITSDYAGTPTVAGDVKGGTRMGNGGGDACFAKGDDLTGACDRVVPTAEDPQVATVQLTKSSTKVTPVAIQEESPKPVTDQSGVIEIKAPRALRQGLATYDKPMRFRIYLQLDPGDDPVAIAQTTPVWRNPDGSAPAYVLPACPTHQRPTKARKSCVARTLSVNETNALGGNDVVFVISTVQNSRWRVGH
jgi:hypothetical protein